WSTLPKAKAASLCSQEQPPSEVCMNAVTTPASTALAPSTASAGSLLMDMAAMERLERVAKLMASGKATVPAHLQRSEGDCFAVTLQSMQWGMNPFAVAQKTHVINGTLGYE